MTVLAYLLIAAAAAASIAIVAGPLRSGGVASGDYKRQGQIADLQAAKAARYREIREAELDRQAGKLTAADWRVIDRELRADAASILHRLDLLGADEES